MSTDTNEATDDRAALGARIAEAMGWSWYESMQLWRAYDDRSWTSEEIVSWEGYGRVDAWMREQGYRKFVHVGGLGAIVHYLREDETVMGTDNYGWDENQGDEPYAALQAALEARDG